ncbi:ankyrin repeat domain-containing protein [Wolbachia endosymbiont of Drosophila tsacasi]|uniref:ankyrin repeat domain-containing protein n=1 Tax=Wolbachia endosymbiont of Drosophila tsacasi TaxID=3002579 RepID=UPI0023A9AC3D|nr:ankyrin repeat domain-containing protein [Wolbachia endosymbiont of Drosophila tsacasi]MDE5062625.1 ankyrin repeat domain-containing protein [Wolbachia endosymbiont of Drosophila tsacasi]
MVTNTEIEQLKNELFAAVKEDNLQKAKECIEKIPEENISKIVNSKRQGETPLQVAVLKNNFEMVKLLIDNYADVNAKDYAERPVLYRCVTSRYCSAQMVEFLINNGASTSGKFTNGDEFFSLLAWAVQDGSPEKAEILLKHGANSDEKFSYAFQGDCTSLHVAVVRNNPEMVKVFIKYHANVNAQNKQGETPLHLAIRFKHPKIIKLLYDNGADIDNVKDIRNQTPSDLAKTFYPDKTIKEIAAEAKSVNISPDNAMQSISVASSAVKPSFFINSIFNWMGASTTAALSRLFQSAPALSSAQQPVTHSAGSLAGSSQVDFYGTALLADVVARKFTGGKYSRPLDDSLLTLEQIKERKLSAIERDVKMAINEFEELNQCPGSSLSNTTVSKGINHQKFF